MANTTSSGGRTDFAYTRGRMTPSLVESMMIRLLACPSLLHEAIGILLPSHFSNTEVQFSAIWSAALQCNEEFSRLTFESMSDRVEELLSDAGEELTQQQADDLYSTDEGCMGILYWSLSQVNPEDIDIEQGRHLLRRFLEERVLADELRRALDFAPGGVPSDLPAIIDRVNQQRERISAVQQDPVETGIPESWEPEALDQWPTTLSFLDTPMAGGHAAGEINGILGPFGVGKTTLGIQMCVEQCRYWHDREQEFGEQGGQVYFFSYEQSASEVRRKAIACAARINLSTMNSLTGEHDFSTRGNLKPYEVEMYTEAGLMGPNSPDPPGELERYAEVKDMLQDHLRIVDLAGGSNGRTGDGYVSEIAAILANAVRRKGEKPRMVVIDHVWLVAYRYLQATGADESGMRNAITMFIDQLKTKVAGPYEIPGWVLHQYNGDANNSSPGRALKHTQAAESKAFAMALSYCFCIGNKDQQTSTARFDVTKTRRSKGDTPGTILYIDGAFSTMVDKSDSFVVYQDKIITREMASQFGGEIEDDNDRRPAQQNGLDGAGTWRP